MTTEQAVHEEKFAFDCKGILTVFFTIMCATALALSQHPEFRLSDGAASIFRVFMYIGVILGLFGALRLIVVVSKGRVAIRADERGITMTRLAFRDKAAKEESTLTPWRKIDLIVVETQQTAPTGANTFLRLYRYRNGMKNQPDSMPIAGWELDKDKLLAVARQYVPDVQFDERRLGDRR